MRREKKYRDNAELAAPHLEQNISHEPLGADEAAPHDPRCHITVTSYRNRNHDPDGLSVKACLDGLVARKILADDSAKEIKEIEYISFVQRDAAEKTVIEIVYE